MEQIKNEKLTVVIAEHGAELHSIKDADGKEYLWDGDARYWNRHSPILFPIVCGLWEDTYRVKGKEYQLHRHGFARDSDFHIIAKGDNQVVFALHDTPETYKKYPFHFNLAISYKLDGNRIHVVWHVENTDNKEIHFQIGGHPAFLVPGCEKGEPMHARLRLDESEPMRLFGNRNGCIVPGYHKVETKDGIWEVDEETFKEDAVIFDHQQLKHIEILGEDDETLVAVDMKTPAVGIWNPYGKHAPFICIEPWYGIHDWAEFDGEFKEKYLMNSLLPGASFMSEYTITIGE
ncbi:aldose 1-epimerase family protein [Segatella albensis]|jgi:galactose mutarotase-like enzyme|uniref:aldose 1-epimerase family protein n=1 Tax=Segatella albensis TaxID=77768 RepID=UPI0004289B6E|nr:aldose 1-epimerase family protein [Segatella albensis]